MNLNITVDDVNPLDLAAQIKTFAKHVAMPGDTVWIQKRADAVDVHVGKTTPVWLADIPVGGSVNVIPAKAAANIKIGDALFAVSATSDEIYREQASRGRDIGAELKEGRRMTELVTRLEEDKLIARQALDKSRKQPGRKTVWDFYEAEIIDRLCAQHPDALREVAIKQWTNRTTAAIQALKDICLEEITKLSAP